MNSYMCVHKNAISSDLNSKKTIKLLFLAKSGRMDCVLLSYPSLVLLNNRSAMRLACVIARPDEWLGTHWK